MNSDLIRYTVELIFSSAHDLVYVFCIHIATALHLEAEKNSALTSKFRFIVSRIRNPGYRGGMLDFFAPENNLFYTLTSWLGENLPCKRHTRPSECFFQAYMIYFCG